MRTLGPRFPMSHPLGASAGMLVAHLRGQNAVESAKFCRLFAGDTALFTASYEIAVDCPIATATSKCDGDEGRLSSDLSVLLSGRGGKFDRKGLL